MRGAKVLVDVSRLLSNYQSFINYIKPTSSVGAVIKADAYGLGAEYIATILAAQPTKARFFVADIFEAAKIRYALRAKNLEAEIYALHGLIGGTCSEFQALNIIPIFVGMRDFETWLAFCKQQDQKLPYALHVDTGLHRLAILKKDWDNVYAAINASFKPHFVMSHFIESERPDSPHNQRQLDELISAFQSIAPLSIANSSGVFLGEAFHLNIVRPGLSLYGGFLNEKAKPFIKNVVHLAAPIVEIYDVKKGEGIGYNHTYICKTPKRIAAIFIGYADGGISRALSNKGYAYIKHYACPILGRISMDLLSIDVSEIPETVLQESIEVEFINDQQTVNEIAKQQEGIPQEILTSLGHISEKRYINQPKTVMADLECVQAYSETI